MEGQQVAPVVLEVGVDAQHAVVVLQVAQVAGELVIGAVHLAEVQEGRQGVDLLPRVGLAAKVVGRVSRPAGGGGPEGGDAAFVATGGEPAVVGRNLDGTKPNLVSLIYLSKKHISLNEKLSLSCRKIHLGGLTHMFGRRLKQGMGISALCDLIMGRIYSLMVSTPHTLEQQLKSQSFL